MTKHIVSIDCETYSEADLPKVGVHKYVEHPSFEILLIGYALDDDPVTVLDLTKGDSTEEFEKLLFDPDITKSAFNAAFERTCFRKHFQREMPPEEWSDTMILASYAGLPRSLKQVGQALRLNPDEAKMDAGTMLIKYFSVPCKPTKINGGRTRNLPRHDPGKWATYIEYNRRDVETERIIRNRLRKFSLPPMEQKLWEMDQKINDRGVMVDVELARNAMEMAENERIQLMDEAQRITGMDNPNSVAQLKEWLGLGAEVTLRKKDVEGLLATESDSVRKRILAIRQEIGKSSVKKYEAMVRAACEDGRVRGTTQFYKANRTGRWAGSMIQPQNLPRNSLEDLDLARDLVRAEDVKAIHEKFGSLNDTLSQLVRTAIIPKPGCIFAVADFSAIEARVSAWLAGEEWVMDAFRDGKDIYCETASQMFHVPVVKHGINGELRQRGKQALLSCSYGGSVGALIAMGALQAGMQEDELQPLVDKWREANPNIVQMWWNMDSSFKQAIRRRGKSVLVNGPRPVLLLFRDDTAALSMALPSGRLLNYIRPRIGVNRFGGESITYEGNDSGHWGRVESFGGKIFENCIAEDTLVLTDEGFIPIQHVTQAHMLWDGTEWVTHSGLIDKGIQETISVNGIRMTPDHRILTEKGWIECGQSKGLDWAKVWLPDSPEESTKHKREGSMAGEMRLRDGEGSESSGLRQESGACDEIVRMHVTAADKPNEHEARYVASSGMGCVALDEAEMHGSKSSGISQLWCAWHNRVRTLAKQLRELLGGHGADLAEGSAAGQDRQQSGLQPGELSVGSGKGKRPEQADEQSHRFTFGPDDNFGAGREIWDRGNHYPVQAGSRLAYRTAVDETRLQKRVYDIRDCGPRHCFVVLDGDGIPRLVHNCVQAVARDCLALAMLRVSQMGYNIVFHVHDEMIVEVEEEKAEKALQDMLKAMSDPVPWAKDLLLKGDGYLCNYYKKD